LALDETHTRIGLIAGEDELEQRLVKVEELAGKDAADRGRGQAAEMLLDPGVGARHDGVVVGRRRGEARDADERPIDTLTREGPRDGRVGGDEADARDARDQRRCGPDRCHRYERGRAATAEACQDQRQDRGGHRRMVTYQCRWIPLHGSSGPTPRSRWPTASTGLAPITARAPATANRHITTTTRPRP